MRYSIGGVNYELVSRAGLIVITGKPETVDFCSEASDLINPTMSLWEYCGRVKRWLSLNSVREYLPF